MECLLNWSQTVFPILSQVVGELLFGPLMPPSLKWMYDVHPELAQHMPERLIDEDGGFAMFKLDQEGWEVPW